MSEEERRQRQGAIVLRRKPGDNAYEGLVEHSFNMGWMKDCVRFWWTGPCYWAGIPMGDIDGMADAGAQADHYRKINPDYEFLVLDARAEDLPVVLDWESWVIAKNKFNDRNIKFTMKE